MGCQCFLQCLPNYIDDDTHQQLELHIYVDENLPSKLLGDDVRIRQVLVNLLNNGVKYTQKGKIVLKIAGRIEGRKAILDFSPPLKVLIGLS